jgi:hypothetical protein
MRTTIIACLIFMPAFLFADKLSATNQDGKAVQELVIRKGLPNFFEKAQRGDTIKVAYLGGSITAQNGWRVYSLDWFREIFPMANFSEINAAIGGTASDFGAFRLHEQVLSFNPDLVFVEFAVNNSNMPEKKSVRSMESIVRKIWETSPETDICFVYTIKTDFIETEQQGNLPPAAMAMEKVAGHYGIPSVNFGHEVCHLLANNQLIFKGEEKEMNGIRVFSPDGVHPYPETGHQVYLTSVKRSFEKMRKDKPSPGKSELPKPLTPNYFSNPQMLDFTEAKLSAGWEIIPTQDHPSFSKFSKHLTKIGKAIPGETLSFRFKGTAIGIYDIMGPDAGKIALEIDGNPKDTIYRFDAYCTYSRMNYILIDDLDDKEHGVVFKVLPGPIDKAGILAKREKVIENPDDYKDNNWYIGKLLIDGKLSHP